MAEPKRITTPLSDEVIKDLHIGDSVLISGVIYTARDSAHKRLIEALERGEELPVDLKGQIIYYAGPAPAKPGKPIGSIGPTTSYRMDPYAPILIEKGLKGMIGKGNRSDEVIEAIKKHTAVYFGAIGGAAALGAKSIKKAEFVAYEDLGPEAIRRLEVVDFPAVVVNDCYGGDIYKQGLKEYGEV
ncbi:Fe-S-containing hydro-lyase [candidate division KSB1 bacterium]|nr:MAG: Fe-S-containing hydro-lyase [candidate division KSB1 bacterium]